MYGRRTGCSPRAELSQPRDLPGFAGQGGSRSVFSDSFLPFPHAATICHKRAADRFLTSRKE